MKGFIFSDGSSGFREVCGTTPLKDLALHLRGFGIHEIYTDSAVECPLVTRAEYSRVRSLLGKDWIAAFESSITRQSPVLLRKKAIAANAVSAVSLACSGRPWLHTAVLTDSRGAVQAAEANPSPENTLTNLCFSGLAWVGDGGFDPGSPVIPGTTSGFLLPGYWRKVLDKESLLRTFHDVLRKAVTPWPHLPVPPHGILRRSEIPENTVIRGTFWLGKDCTTGEGCEFENCVIMDGASVGSQCRLKNCLVLPGVSVPGGTLREDKYLTLLGE